MPGPIYCSHESTSYAEDCTFRLPFNYATHAVSLHAPYHAYCLVLSSVPLLYSIFYMVSIGRRPGSKDKIGYLLAWEASVSLVDKDYHHHSGMT